jgi:hypothetical protein
VAELLGHSALGIFNPQLARPAVESLTDKIRETRIKVAGVPEDIFNSFLFLRLSACVVSLASVHPQDSVALVSLVVTTPASLSVL